MSAAIATQRETFCRELQTMQRGAFDDEITAAVRELVVEMTQAVEKGTSKPKAKLTITVDLTLDRGMMDLTADFAVKHPKKVRGRTVMYPGPGGTLLPHDPQQLSLEVPGARDTAVEGTRNVHVVN